MMERGWCDSEPAHNGAPSPARRWPGQRLRSGEMLEERDDPSNPAVYGIASAGWVGHYPDNHQDRHDDAEDPLKHRSRLPTRGRTAPHRVLRRAALEHADGNRSSDRLVLIMPTLGGNIRVRNDTVTFRTPRKPPERVAGPKSRRQWR